MNHTERPYVLLKAALSLDGFLDDCSQERLVFSNTEDAEAVDVLRASCDAILVGAGTMRADNPRLRIRSEKLRADYELRTKTSNPLRVTVTKTGEFRDGLAFFENDNGESKKEPLPLVFCPAGLESGVRSKLSAKAEVLALPERDEVCIEFVLKTLKARGIERLIVEGGAALHSAFLSSSFVDEIRLAYAPIVLGERGGTTFRSFRGALKGLVLISVEKLDTMSVLKFSSKRSGCK